MPHLDAFAFEDRAYRLRHVVVLARDQSRRHLHHRDARAEAAKHLRELQADVTAADDQQVLGEGVELEHAAVVERSDLVEPFDGRPRGFGADVEEDLRRRKRAAVHVDRVRSDETRVAADQLESVGTADPLRQVRARLLDDVVLARLHGGHVDMHRRIEPHAPFGRAPRHLRGARAGHPGLGRDAADVDAGAAQRAALDECGLQAFLRAAHGKGRAGLAGADDERVEAFAAGHVCAFRG
jgi:hypothetical protein